MQATGRAIGAVALAHVCTLLHASPLQLAPEKVIKARQSAYYLMGQEMALINASIKGNVHVDKPRLQMSANALELLSRIAFENFPSGSDQGAPTKAKPEIWKDAGHFKQLADEMTAQTANLKAAVASGDVDVMKMAYGATSRSCKACHDNFKAQ